MLSDMACRCEKRFCALHRQPEIHKCTFDFKAHGKSILEKTVIGCQREKIEGVNAAF
jgi:predicted nucleic acid binding AN1-type Zn finger protein